MPSRQHAVEDLKRPTGCDSNDIKKVYPRHREGFFMNALRQGSSRSGGFQISISVTM